MQKLSRSALSVALLLILSKLLGFIRELSLAYQFGTSYIVDAYTSCITLPSVLFAIYVYGVSDAYIPVYMRLREERERSAFFSNVITMFTAVSLLFSVGCFLGASQIATLLSPGFEGQARALLIYFIHLVAFVFPIATANSLLSAQLQAGEHFIFVNFCAFIVVNVIEIIGILLASASAPGILVGGYLTAYLVVTILMSVFSLRRTGLRYRPRFRLQEASFLLLCRMAIPLGASRLVNQLNSVMDRVLASVLGEGVISALNYADKIQLIFYSLTTSVFLSVCFPQISRRFAEGNLEGGLYFVRRATLLALYISVPVTGGLFLFANPLVSFLLERGSFSSGSTAMTASCLAFYALGIPFYALREIGIRALSAHMEQRRILKNTVISVACNIILDLMLIRPLGYVGLALATSLAGLIAALLMFSDLRKLDMRILDRRQIPEFLKISAASAISLFLCWCVYCALLGPLGGSPALVIAGVLAIAAYVLLSVWLGIEIFVWLYDRLPARLQIFSTLNQRRN